MRVGRSGILAKLSIVTEQAWSIKEFLLDIVGDPKGIRSGNQSQSRISFILTTCRILNQNSVMVLPTCRGISYCNTRKKGLSEVGS